MLSHNDLKKGIKFILDGQPYEVLDSSFVFKGRGSSLSQTKIKNLITGDIISRSFRPGEKLKEAEIEKTEVKFLYSHRDKFFFCEKRNSSTTKLPQEAKVKKRTKSSSPTDTELPQEAKVKKRTKFSSPRFDLPKEVIQENAIFLKPNEVVEGVRFQSKIINISLPIKVQLKVIEAPPGIRGDRAQGGTKIVTLETGAKINTPLFVEIGDIIEINTEKKEYVRRIE